MPLNILNLPREIRDEIYSYVLISPSSYVEPLRAPRPPPPPAAALVKPPATTVPRPKRTTSPPSSSSNLQFVLSIRPFAESPVHPRTPDHDAEHTTYLSLSILRVCRQIHSEAVHLFYERNTLYFAAIYHSKCCPGVIKTLKGMGQIASRRIVSISMHMSTLTANHMGFGKVLQVLASRARQGHFRRLELAWDLEDLFHCAFVNRWMGMRPRDDNSRAFEELVLVLRRAAGGGSHRYERILKLPRGVAKGSAGFLKSRESREAVADMEEVVRVLHCAFGGKVYWGDDLAWEDGRKVEGTGYYRS